ncbi:MAG: enoyl-CoA hydratase [Immundisolibacteraceae bacterium]|nr:enoyl-CoA hydratase [Immundisolibacteraceae bacterium]
MNDQTQLLIENSGAVRRLTLNSPQRRNPLSKQLIDQLWAQLEASALDETVKVVVIGAAGSVFCAGHDLAELATMNRSQRQVLMDSCSRLMAGIKTIPQPVIAQVQGVATAAGCQLVASCDLAVAGKSARFATPGVNIGLFCSTPAVALGRAVPDKLAMKMLLTGKMIGAEQALQMGLISDLVEDLQLTDATNELAQLIAAKSASCISGGKQAFYRQQGLSLDLAYADASAEMVKNLDAAPATEGIAAFLDKRSPSWPD